ncbi:MAG TPA: acetylxylan esterase [Pirellulales bacterium]|jgi:pimeloyl-ACP methyl ester carboxylesterase|nr:acetylxylan esterase [Pirellulales bacterium]
MNRCTRREALKSGLALSAAAMMLGADRPQRAASDDLQRYLLALAGRFEAERKAQFAAVRSAAELVALQKSLREKLLHAVGGLPERGEKPPAATRTGTLEADDYTIEKLLLESRPGYFLTALCYRPKRAPGAASLAAGSGVLSPCGHSALGKGADAYQILHANLARRGYTVLTYDPLGQAERSQFWDRERERSKFNLVCGEHAVLGNPLYAFGMNLARYRIADGMRALDYLASLPEIDAKRLACVGNSGGGTLTAYLAALDERIAVAAICCYITSLAERMASRMGADPDADPEQDLFGFASAGIDHAGLLALRAPRPTMLGVAEFDFFPIAGARATCAEAEHLFQVADAPTALKINTVAEKHGLSLPMRQNVYRFLQQWLPSSAGPEPLAEAKTVVRSARELQVTRDGQVNGALRSKHFFTIVREDLRGLTDFPPAKKVPLLEALRLGNAKLESLPAGPTIDLVFAPAKRGTLLIWVAGNDSPPVQEAASFVQAIKMSGHGFAVVEPCAVGSRQVWQSSAGLAKVDPLASVEADLAYNTFLVGRSVLSLRVADVLLACVRMIKEHEPRRLILCGRRDAALVALFAAAVEPRVTGLAVEEMLLSYAALLDPAGRPIQAAAILPGLLRSFGDLAEVLKEVLPRAVLLAQCAVPAETDLPKGAALRRNERPFSADPQTLLDWLETVVK